MVRMTVVILAWGCLLAQAEDLREQLLRCGKLEDAELRLAAFDQAAKDSAARENVEALPLQPPAVAPVPPPEPAAAVAVEATGPFGIDFTGVREAPNQGKWKVDSWRSEMDDKRAYRAYLAAKEPVEAATHEYYPFLQVRHEEGKLQVYITYDEVLSADTATVTSRVGKRTPTSEAWLTSTDFKAVFCPGDPCLFLQALCRDPKLVVRVTPHGENPRTVTFDTRGLANILQSMAKAVASER